VETTSPDDATPRVPEAGIFDLARREPPPVGWAFAIAPAFTAWVGNLAFLGQFRRIPVSDGLARLAPLDSIFWILVAVALVGLVGSAVRRNRRLAVLWSAVLGFLLGHILFAWVFQFLPLSWRVPFRTVDDSMGFAGQRLVYGICVGASAFTATLAAAWALDSWPTYDFRVGNFHAVGRDFTHLSKPTSYWTALLGFALFAAILWVILQCSVGLKPLRLGTLGPLVPAILLAACCNALIEEILFRGVLQPAFVHAAGLARGLWIQGLMFGLLHWGMSVGLVAALPTALLIGVGSVYWGKAVMETRGLAWVVIAHTMVDCAIMCAYFVPLTE
jgi:membrane protease YdiL (CAAX protease family)